MVLPCCTVTAPSAPRWSPKHRVSSFLKSRCWRICSSRSRNRLWLAMKTCMPLAATWRIVLATVLMILGFRLASGSSQKMQRHVQSCRGELVADLAGSLAARTTAGQPTKLVRFENTSIFVRDCCSQERLGGCSGRGILGAFRTHCYGRLSVMQAGKPALLSASLRNHQRSGAAPV